jgi:DNA modification methylase
MSDWPADKVERWPIDRLIPYARNARTHSDAQVAQIAGSIREWGWTMPALVAEDGTIIAGHGRVLAAQRLGISDVPVMVARGWSAAQKRAYVIADNKLALNAGWDEAMLRLELSDLRDLGANLGLIGFSGGELAGIFARADAGLTDPDEIPAELAAPVSVIGDVWLLGGHRVVCGDCTEGTAVGSALRNIRPTLMVTDPPYGVGYDPNWRNVAYRSAAEGRNGRKGGGRILGAVLNDDRSDWREAWALFPGDVAYVWHASLHSKSVIASLEAADFELRAQIIWDKQRPIIGRANYHWQHEPCWYAVRKGATGNWSGDRKQTTVWQIEHWKSDTGHGTQKPVACMERPILNNSSPGQAIYDPFVGSGTTIIAAEMTGRACHAIELSPTYVDVAVRRWEAFTGKTATLEANGKTFAEIADARGVDLDLQTDGAARAQA